ncbi:SRPBCC domain-containing protein [Hoeflea sp. G2-23]|uniref:SRPBCC domain-containing protein n=1 Tax=Hoeflea algicola TaxID=2983763 RepID=A0ABT3Z3R8_9HYPH|nr:SRPBCC domain-containing protein [Hoeflea algicola]MCY0146387.1 SRPBCC domain-containing protein [Hoeflea algicola]
MSDLTLERNFPQPPEKVFAFVTRTEHLLSWWGPEGMGLRAHALDFTRPGAWSSTLVNAEGGLHKMSGEVIEVDPPRAVEFTWGWHDDKDVRGHESRVRFEIEPDAKGGSIFRLIHSGLVDEESAANHNRGWTSTLRKLEQLAGA